MAISKVILNNDVQIDITDTTASQSDVASTKYYYGADGVKKQGSYVAPSAVTQATPTISVNTSTGLITASATQSAGVVSAGTKSATEQLSTEAGKIVTPTTSEQTAVAANKYTLGAIKVAAMPAGSAATPATSITANPSISVSSGGLITATASATKSVTPTVSAGYVSSGTAGTITVSGSNTEQLSTQAAQTLYPSTSDQTISSGKYLTGTQTVKGVLLTNLTADNIADGVTVKVGDSADDDRIASVTGTHKGGVVSEPEKDVNYIDYDGTILYSYTKTEFASLSAHPANPVHDGLTAQGWNWTLSNAKTYVAKYGSLWIGQMYIPSDNKTHIYINLGKSRTSPIVGCCPNGTVVVDWGDGSATETLTGTSLTTVQYTSNHQYASSGDYEITLSVTSGSVALMGSSSTYGGAYLLRDSATDNSGRNQVYADAITKVEIGANVNIGNYAFSRCYNIESITLPNSLTSIGNNAFFHNYSTYSYVIPSSVTEVGNAWLSYNYLKNIALPKVLQTVGTSQCANCVGLREFVIPDTITTIQAYSFSTCYGLTSITIPDSVTTINAYAFQSCMGLGALHFTASTPPTVANSNAWSSVPSSCIIYVPSGKKSAYTSANNYPSSSTYTYVEE